MTTPLLDFEALTAPIPGEQPAGVRLLPDVRKKLEDARKDFEPHPDDPSQPPIPKKPDWSAIVRLAGDSLAEKSKDLLAAVRLIEALTKRDGFTGLRDGVHLLRLLLTDAWDRVHPLIEGPDDLEYRAGPIQWLFDRESGAWFPLAVEKLPLLKLGDQDVCLRDCKDGKLNGQPLAIETIRAAQPATATIAAEVADALADLKALDQALSEKMADQAPSLAGLLDVLTDCKRFLDTLSVADSEAATEGTNEAGDGAAQTRTSSPGGKAGRTEMYRQLARLADDLSAMEPHSPIPDLLRWAVKLGAMPFRELIQELVQEPAVLADIRRQLGIKQEEPTA